MSSSKSQGDGTTLGGYVLGQRLAAGGMAELYTAKSTRRSFGEAIVLKRMLPHLASDKRFVEMFVNEARISSQLDHPNIVRVLDFEATGQGLALVMELVNGPDLLTVLKRCSQSKIRIPRELAVYIACHVLEALDYAHGVTSNGRALHVVHRDVSPSNILLTRAGHVKLADFGIARAAERQHETAAGTLKGKYCYMSPEQVEGRNLDGRSDVFAMGIVLAESLMSKRLFSSPNDLDILLMVRRGDLSRWDEFAPKLPVELDAIVRKALVVDRDKRFASAGAFRDALADWLSQSSCRTGAAMLAAFLRKLETDSGDLCAWGSKSSPTLSGTQTQLARIEIRKTAEPGRRRPTEASASDADSTGRASRLQVAPTGRAQSAASPRSRQSAAPYKDHVAMSRGRLGEVLTVDLMADIYARGLSGLLTMQHGKLRKDAYFRDGNPEFVSSNVPEDLLGQFLLRRGILTGSDFERVMDFMPKFGGRFAQTMVNLGIVKPVDAVRLLAAQVSQKLVDAAHWHSGDYMFRPGVRNPNPASSLGLRTTEIVSACLSSIPGSRLRTWIATHGEKRPVLDSDGVLADFSFGQDILAALGQFRGRRPLKSFSEVAKEPEGEEVLAAAYVLWRAGTLQLREGREEVPGGRPAKAPGPDRGDQSRRYPRVPLRQPATIRLGGRGATQGRPTPARLHTASCEGLGLTVAGEHLQTIQRGVDLSVQFMIGSSPIDLRGRVAWCKEQPDGSADLGIELRLALASRATRQAFAHWIVQMIRHGQLRPGN